MAAKWQTLYINVLQLGNLAGGYTETDIIPNFVLVKLNFFCLLHICAAIEVVGPTTA